MKTRKSSLSLILAVLMLFVASVASAALTPNADGVYEIGTEAELKEFRDGINDGTIPADSDAKLMANITLTENWKPIGLYDTTAAIDYGYLGTFDGNNMSISGLTIGSNDMFQISSKQTGGGIFGTINPGGVVENLTIQDVNLSANDRTGVAFGALAAQALGAKIQNIRVVGGSVRAYFDFTTNTLFSNVYVGGLLGQAKTNTEILTCQVSDMDTISGGFSGGIVGAISVGSNMSNNSTQNINEITGQYYAGSLAGLVQVDTVVFNNFAKDVNLIRSLNQNETGLAYVGCLLGIINSATGVEVRNNVFLGGDSTLVSANSTNTKTGPCEGGVLGFLAGAETALESVQNCMYVSTNITFNSGENKPIGNIPLASMDAQYNVGAYDATLSEGELPAIVVALDSYTLTLAVGESRTFDASTLPGKAGDFACEWGVDDASIASIAGEGLSVTVTGVAVGSSIVTAKIRGDINVDLSCMVNVVEETDEADSSVTGTPADGTIYPGEDVDLVYDFSPYIAIAVDNSGMQTPISGLVADILDGKVVVMGVSKEAGTYFYVVTLQRPDGSTFTQKVYVTIQGGSRPTGDTKSGGGSSNCNTGVGAALFALLGLALIQKRK